MKEQYSENPLVKHTTTQQKTVFKKGKRTSGNEGLSTSQKYVHAGRVNVSTCEKAHEQPGFCYILSKDLMSKILRRVAAV